MHTVRVESYIVACVRVLQEGSSMVDDTHCCCCCRSLRIYVLCGVAWHHRLSIIAAVKSICVCATRVCVCLRRVWVV